MTADNIKRPLIYPSSGISTMTSFFMLTGPTILTPEDAPVSRRCAWCDHVWTPTESGKCRNCGARNEP